MPWLYLIPAIVVVLVVTIPLLYFLTRHLSQREPYKSFLHLQNRSKLSFFRMLLADPRVPLRVKALPFLLVPYLLSPIDIVPDFIPVLGYLDDVGIVLGTLALVMRWTPRPVIDDLLGRLEQRESAAPQKTES